MTTAVRPVSRTAYRLAMGVLRLLFDGYLTVHVSGRAHLPSPGVPALLVANHTSALDVFAAGYALGRPAYFLAKQEATEMPLLGPWLLAVGAVPARRDQRDTEALRALMTVLRAGHLVGLAPEGTRSTDGIVGEYDPGFVWLAAKTDALVVPCAIHGARELMPRGARWPRRGHLWVRFGEPRSLAQEGRRPSRERMEAIAAEVRAETVALLDDLAAEAAGGARR
jgi:1-acyl-sn-glycerol-3-phosphate acyltransferase